MRPIYWYCFDMPDSEEFVSEALKELADNLRKFPTRIEVIIEKLPDELRREVSKQLQETRSFPETAAEIGDILCKGQGNIPGLFVFCRRDSNIVVQAREAEPLAQRECGAKCGCLAVVWESGNKMLIWHEVLHLLGAKDCYDPETGEGTCENSGCIMQYEPTDENVAEWPDCLCIANIDILCYPRSKKRIYTKQYTDESSKIIRYSLFESLTGEDKSKSSWHFGKHIATVTGWHTRLFDLGVNFETACRFSTALSRYDKDKKSRGDLSYNLIMGRDKDEEKISLHVWDYPDGSSITEAYIYKPNET